MAWIIGLVASRLGVSQALANLIAIGVAIVLASGAAWGVYAFIKHKGAEEVRAKIEKENRDAIEKGLGARMSFDDCLAAGGVYDFKRQRCSRPSLGHR
ncbi:hypothetical protein NKH37_29045 [Mesorhizobium sp. M1217]|uniref:hypothetical protein n=1 Tax=Mesorhizobium sp. M1217 TaxID=2957070 RepID=UPI00333CBC4F